MSRPLFSTHRRLGNGPQYVGQNYHYATTSYPSAIPPQFNTSNPNRCPHNSNAIFEQPYMANHIGDMSNNSISVTKNTAIEVANTFTTTTTSTITMKNAVACNETVIDDEQNNGHVSKKS